MNIASIDIGSNTVLMTIAKIKDDKIIQTLKNFYEAPRISQGIKKNKIISSEKINLLKKILLNYKNIAKEYQCEKILCVGTSPFRNAGNSFEVIEDIRKTLGLEIRILDGKTEARLSYLGATYESYFDKVCALIDIGGGSSELTIGKGNDILFNESFDTGAIKITESFIDYENIKNSLSQAEAFLDKVIKIDKIHRIEKTIAVAGTPTSLMAIKLNLKEYSDVLVDDKILDLKDIENFIDIFSKLKPAEALARFGQPLQGREDIILAGCLLLKKFMMSLDAFEIIVSSKGLRYGVIVEFLQNSKTIFQKI